MRKEISFEKSFFYFEYYMRLSKLNQQSNCEFKNLTRYHLTLINYDFYEQDKAYCLKK